MEIRRHPNTNQVIGPPADMQDGSCSSLPVIAFTDNDGMWMQSFWKPTQEELTCLLAGGSVALQVRAGGRQHPVVAVGVTPDETEAV